ncbi:uncharacterized protein wu:fa56d06 [Sardina pilchardus]|uniref:uncharacterized protein wu:fa56d06 n=1 Tax=Sardina pilchardus TaxID=27697 RepID=UPI002E0E0004
MDLLAIPRTRLRTFGDAPTLWNTLPLNLRSAPSLPMFKNLNLEVNQTTQSLLIDPHAASERSQSNHNPGHDALPLRKVGRGRVRHVPPHRPMMVHTPLEDWQVVARVPVENHRQEPARTVDHADNRRQGTEPARRFLVDLNTGLLKDYVGEMSRKPSGFYVPPKSDGFRQGTENSHATLVDPMTGHLLLHTSEMKRGSIENLPILSDEFRHTSEMKRGSTENIDMPILPDEFRHSIEYSWLKKKDMQGKDIGKMESEVVAVPLVKGGWVRDADQVLRAAPEVVRRQGTEPSRRFLVDLNTGLLKDHVDEMDRKPSGFYVPPKSDGFRQGTENSHATLVDPMTGHLLLHTSEMKRGSIENEFRHTSEMKRGSTENEFSHSTGQLLHHASEMKRGSIAAAPEMDRRQGTEASRRFLVDLNSGLLKDHVDEISRKPSGFYVPPKSDGFKQGTENSHATLVDPMTGHLLLHTSEMKRGSIEKRIHAASEEFKHGMEYSHFKKQDDGHNEIMEPVHDTVNDEFSHSLEFSHFKMRNDIRGPAQRTDTAVWLRETLPVGVTCSGEIIDGRCYQFNPTPLTFSEAESSCQDLYAGGHIAAVTSADLHINLVSMVTVASNGPTLTWLGGVKKAQQYEWLDGSAWGYTDWMPGHPNLQKGRVTCVEMFRMEASWWTSVDCNLKRASICSFPMAA